MGENATIEAGYITVKTRAWLEQRTEGPIDELTALFEGFAVALAACTRPTMHPVTTDMVLDLFIRARSGSDWADGEPHAMGTIYTSNVLSLTQAVTIHRYTDPEYGDVAMVSAAYGQHSDDLPAAYIDAAWIPHTWFTIRLKITCVNGHQFISNGTEISTNQAPPRPVADVFPGSRVITRAPRVPGATDSPETWEIICPTCRGFCDVELADLEKPRTELTAL